MRRRIAVLGYVVAFAVTLSGCTERPHPVGPATRGPAADLSQSSSSGTLVLINSTTLTGNHYGNIVVNADNITLDCAGDTVFGPGVPGFSGGIEIDGRNGVTVRNCTVTGFTDINGIFAGGASSGRYEGNVLYNNGPHGMHIDFGSGNVIVHNTSRSNRDVGIALTRSTQSLIDSNTTSQNSLGIVLDNNSNANTIADNTVQDNTGESGILLQGGSSGNHLIHNTASRNSIGIVLDNGANTNELRTNTANSNTLYGFFARASTNLIVVANTSLQNGIGFVLWNVTASQFVGNNTNLNHLQGFEVIQGSAGNTLDSNTVNQNLIGIEITDGSNSNTIRRNVATGNTFEGYKFFSATNNTVAVNIGNSNGTFGFLVFGGSSFNTLTGNIGHANKSLDALDDDSGTGNVWATNNFGTKSGF